MLTSASLDLDITWTPPPTLALVDCLICASGLLIKQMTNNKLYVHTAILHSSANTMINWIEVHWINLVPMKVEIYLWSKLFYLIFLSCKILSAYAEIVPVGPRLTVNRSLMNSSWLLIITCMSSAVSWSRFFSMKPSESYGTF